MTKKREKNVGTGMLEVVFILDRSGSMRGKEEDTIGGFNSMLEKQMSESDNIIWSTVLFDSRSKVIHDRLPISEMRPLTEKEYYTRGMTALLDALGRSIDYISRAHKIEKKNAPERTLFVITTDGYENVSSQYSRERVMRMIRTRVEKYGWEFVFLGAGIDSVREGGSIGIRSERCINYLNDTEGMKKSYEALGDAVRYMALRDNLDDGLFDSVREDYDRRSRKGRYAGHLKR